jgi:hypothetical protein
LTGGSAEAGVATTFPGTQSAPKPGSGPVAKVSTGERTPSQRPVGGSVSITVTVSKGGYDDQAGESNKGSVQGAPLGGGFTGGVGVSVDDQGKVKSVSLKVGFGASGTVERQTTCNANTGCAGKK